MVSRQHQDWINRGKPNSGLARPLAQLRDLLRGAGYTVFDFPDDRHLNADPPEDHTFYSETGWPHGSPKWFMHAIDIMPPPAGKHVPSLQALGQRIFDDRQAGRITWLKYMNWPSDGDLDKAVKDKWQPHHSRGTSTDIGHLHLSCVTGVEALDAPYNPLTGVVLAGAIISHTPATPVAAAPEPVVPDPALFFAVRSDGVVHLCDGMRSRPLGVGEVADLRTLVDEGLVAALNDPRHPRGGFYEGAFGDARTPVPVALDIHALAARIGAAVVDAIAHLEAADQATVEGAVRHALG